MRMIGESVLTCGRSWRINVLAVDVTVATAAAGVVGDFVCDDRRNEGLASPSARRRSMMSLMTAWDVCRTLASRLGGWAAAPFCDQRADREAPSAWGSRPGGRWKLNIGESVTLPGWPAARPGCCVLVIVVVLAVVVDAVVGGCVLVAGERGTNFGT
jgi:hypothetical protein